MTYPTPLNDLLSLAALFGIPVFLGLLISIIMFRRGTCWLSLLSGVAIKIYLNYVEVLGIFRSLRKDCRPHHPICFHQHRCSGPDPDYFPSCET